MGSKQALLPFIMRSLDRIEFDSVMDAFSGSACVSYAMKLRNKRVVANDFLKFAYHIAAATIQNNTIFLSPNDVALLLKQNRQAGDFVRRNYVDVFFSEEDCEFIDNVRTNIDKLPGRNSRSIALAALCRACMKKRPRGIFTFTGHKGWDGRRDLKLTMRQQFLDAVDLFNGAVFTNGKRNSATCLDVFDTVTNDIDLVYIDTPYVSKHSDCDYTRRYHFVEGLCTYWKDLEIQAGTTTKKFRSYQTDFSTPTTVRSAFLRLFRHFRKSILVVSYSSNGIPNRDDMVAILRQFKKNVVVFETPHKYSFGNHRHKVGDNNNDVTEYLFVAR